MDYSLVLRVIGILLLIVGIVLVWNPELVSKQAVPENTFAATERRIWWGLIIGFGTLLLFHHDLQPWMATIAATASALLFGLLVARLIGIMLDGSVLKQWINVGIELVMLVPLVWWYLRVRS
ncbi:DUF4345 family protein [Granulosicoccus sp. 3-233]|uniref:DUF4345 family protein n=1 Tax=Granulosicoccus sp. 3-233 TaxID=3417969 RepID=UPI003D34BEA6